MKINQMSLYFQILQKITRFPHPDLETEEQQNEYTENLRREIWDSKLDLGEKLLLGNKLNKKRTTITTNKRNNFKTTNSILKK